VERQEIAQRRSTIEVLDRQALEARACECYWVGKSTGRAS
jgi:hypothetical protein